MLAARKSNSSGPFPEKLPNPSVRFGAARAEHFPHAIDMSSGNGHVSNHLQAESLGTGFILLDACFRLVCASEEALAILAYPRVPSENKGFESFLQGRIRSLLPSNGGHNGLSPSEFPNEFASGKRCYEVRAFSVKSNLKNGQRPAVALLLKRKRRGILDLQTVARKLRMTPRETETVDFLVQGLGTKQMASRMGISPNPAGTRLCRAPAPLGGGDSHRIARRQFARRRRFSSGWARHLSIRAQPIFRPSTMWPGRSPPRLGRPNW